MSTKKKQMKGGGYKSGRRTPIIKQVNAGLGKLANQVADNAKNVGYDLDDFDYALTVESSQLPKRDRIRMEKMLRIAKDLIRKAQGIATELKRESRGFDGGAF